MLSSAAHECGHKLPSSDADRHSIRPQRIMPAAMCTTISRLGTKLTGPQESALQVDGSKLTDAVAASSPAKPIEQSDAPSIPQQSDPQGSTLQIDGFEMHQYPDAVLRQKCHGWQF
jgi:hypothetical protein